MFSLIHFPDFGHRAILSWGIETWLGALPGTNRIPTGTYEVFSAILWSLLGGAPIPRILFFVNMTLVRRVSFTSLVSYKYGHKRNLENVHLMYKALAL